MAMQRDYHQVIAKANRWAVYYGAEEPAEAFLPYDVVVFDAIAHPPLAPLKSPDRLVLGYISFGEEGTHHSLHVHKKDGVRLEKNTFWGEQNYILDLRSEPWAEDILKRQIPTILAKGFDGIMIDTIEAPFAVTKTDTEANAEMKLSAIKLIKAVRQAYPEMPIMLNRGFDILPEVAKDIDMVLGESVTTDYDFTTGSTHFRSQQDQDYLVRVLGQATYQNKKLRVFSLNYWPPEQKAAIQQIYHMDRDKGYVPYVSTVDLAHHYIEPAFAGKN